MRKDETLEKENQETWLEMEKFCSKLASHADRVGVTLKSNIKNLIKEAKNGDCAFNRCCSGVNLKTCGKNRKLPNLMAVLRVGGGTKNE